jgi:hypothetical protein
MYNRNSWVNPKIHHSGTVACGTIFGKGSSGPVLFHKFFHSEIIGMANKTIFLYYGNQIAILF